MTLISGSNLWSRDALDSAPAEVMRLRAQLDCIPVTVVRLDGAGRITHVNDAWRRFASENDADVPTLIGIGQNYLEVCANSHDSDSQAVAQGIRDVMADRAADFELSYRCHSSQQRRWFRLVVRKSPERDSSVVIAHSDITKHHLAEIRSYIQASAAEAYTQSKSFLSSCRDLASITCEKLEWDYLGVWRLDPSSWTLRCVDVWTRPDSDLLAFEQATRVATLGPGVGLPGRAWEEQKGLWVTDDAIDPELSGAAAAQRWRIMPPAAVSAGFRSGFAFPLCCDGDVLAVIELFGRIREAGDGGLLSILELSGAQIALAELRDRSDVRAEGAQAEADLARDQLEAVLICVPALVMAVNRNGKIKFRNQAPPLRTRAELVGTPWTECVPLAEQPRIETALKIVLDGGAAHMFETCVTSLDGSVTRFANYVGPMSRAGRITGAVLVSEDVTSLRSAEAALSDSQRLASIGTLAAGVAHEINTPLQFISDNVEFLRDATRDLLAAPAALALVCKALDTETLSEASQASLAVARAALKGMDSEYLKENVPQALALCVEGLERVTTIVRSLKTFAHPAQLEMAPADLNRAIMATLTVARNEYRYVADIETEFGEIPLVVCHINQINQVVLNILINASHALADLHRGTASKGLVRVRTYCDGDSVVIAIRDNAGGIPEHIRGRIYDPFFTTKEVGRGTGQGLAIAWNTIKEVHGGELSFETNVGQGTEFFIRLPCHGRS